MAPPTCLTLSTTYFDSLITERESATLQSTRSSPSPPPTPHNNVNHNFANGKSAVSRPRRRRSTASTTTTSTTRPGANVASRPSVIDWSTSYLASASSSTSRHRHPHLGEMDDGSSTFDEFADSDSILSRQSRPAKSTPSVSVASEQQVEDTIQMKRAGSPIATRKSGDHTQNGTQNGSGHSHGHGHTHVHTRIPSSFRHWSSVGLRDRRIVHLLPKYYLFNTPIPHFNAKIDIRRFIEHSILFGGVSFSIFKLLFQKHNEDDVVQQWWIVRGTFNGHTIPISSDVVSVSVPQDRE